MTNLITLVLSFVLILIVIAAMGIGVLAGRAPIKGSCGGLNGGRCELCSGSGQCRKRGR
ncbi:MAG: Na(+)-translocating NADH-quinone reductase subunit E [Woeseiaceae bacterium]|nr:Na(+)-translocating NADH-quinone reductase subunit E [Woeseiaceae bacterium]